MIGYFAVDRLCPDGILTPLPTSELCGQPMKDLVWGDVLPGYVVRELCNQHDFSSRGKLSLGSRRARLNDPHVRKANPVSGRVGGGDADGESPREGRSTQNKEGSENASTRC